MQIVDVPGVGEVEFPDSMGDAEILAAVKGLSGPQMGASHGPFVPLPRTKPDVPVAESGVRGALQGASLGWGDEAAGAIDALLPDSLRNDVSREAVGKGATWRERFESARDYYRRRNAQAQESNPGTYLAGQVAGATAPTLVGGAPATGLKGLGVASGQGMAQGAGYSDAASLPGLVGDTALGGALGVAGYGAGTVLGKGASALRRKGAEKLGLAQARAGSQAAKEVAEDLASKTGQLGAETQKGSRYVENLMRLEASMTPEQRAVYAELQASGVVPHLQQSVAQGTLEALPSQATTIAAKKAALEAAQQAAPQAATARAADLLKPQVKADTLSYLKSYAEPMIWALGAQQAGSALGLSPVQQGELAAAAGIIGGRTRAGKALWNRINRPGNQAALGRIMSRAGNAGEGSMGMALRKALAGGVPAAAIAARAEQDPEVLSLLEALRAREQ